MASQAVPYITPEDYLKAERKAAFKSEYCDGQVFAMAGATLRHSRIATNLVIELGAALKGGRCQVFNSDLRVYIPATGLYTYPDASVVCGDPVVFQTDNLENPVVIAEVLSKSTQHHDRTTKFLDYQSIPSLKEICWCPSNRVASPNALEPRPGSGGSKSSMMRPPWFACPASGRN